MYDWLKAAYCSVEKMTCRFTTIKWGKKYVTNIASFVLRSKHWVEIPATKEQDNIQ